MAKMHLHVGIDDTGTGTGTTTGFTFVTMPQAHVPAFEAKTHDLLKLLGRPEFHAKDFGAKKRTPAFVGFLELIRDYALRSLQVRAVTCLYASSKSILLQKEAKSALEAVAKEIGLAEKDSGLAVLDEAMHLAPHVMSIIKHSDWLGPNITIAVEIASGPKTHFVGTTICTIDGVPWDAPGLVRAAMNRIVARRANNTPALSLSPIRIVAARNSCLVQAADVFGNFFLSYLRHEHGACSRGVVEKAGIVGDVFKQLLRKAPLSSGLSWKDSGDLVIPEDRFVTTSLRAYMTHPPRGKSLADFPGAVAPGTRRGRSRKESTRM